jgi:hypothetical protein
MSNKLDNIFENNNYIIIINSINKKVKFEIDFNEDTNYLLLKRTDEHNDNGWIEKLFLHIFDKKTKQENKIYIGSSIKNEVSRIINLKKKKIYIALSTIPSRANEDILLKNINHFILSQTESIEKIFITLPKKYLRFKEKISENIITKLKLNSKIEIIDIEQDYGPASKYLGPLIHKYDIIKNNLLFIIDDDRIYNKNIIKNFIIAHNSYPTIKFMTGLWTTYFDKNYKAMHPDYLDINLKKEENNNKINYGDGVGGFYGFCLNIIDNEFKDFIQYNHTILNKIKKSCFHDEGIILSYLKVREEYILYLKHIGCHFVNMKEPDALWKSNLCDRKKMEYEIVELTNKEHLLD